MIPIWVHSNDSSLCGPSLRSVNMRRVFVCVELFREFVVKAAIFFTWKVTNWRSTTDMRAIAANFDLDHEEKILFLPAETAFRFLCWIQRLMAVLFDNETIRAHCQLLWPQNRNQRYIFTLIIHAIDPKLTTSSNLMMIICWKWLNSYSMGWGHQRRRSR